MTGPPRLTPLSAREMEVARLVAEGLADKEIASILIIRIGTVKTHLDRIAAKIGADKRKNRRIAITRHIERAELPAPKNGAAA